MAKSGVEYADYQITVYPPPCPYQCTYCFWRTPVLEARARYIAEKFSFERRLEEARRLRDKDVTVVVSFTTDPYPPQEASDRRTRRILEAFVGGKARVMVLTKNPKMALRDIDLFRRGGFWLGTTVTCLPHHFDGVEPTEETCKLLEPLAPSPSERLDALAMAKMHGIHVWLSVEPIHRHTNLVYIVKRTWRFIDLYVFGALNYSRQLGLEELRPSSEEYVSMIEMVMPILKKHGKKYIIKKELRGELAKAGYIVSGIGSLG